MSDHYLVKCQRCHTVMEQCRCSAPNKTVVYRVCDECKKHPAVRMVDLELCLAALAYAIYMQECGKDIRRGGMIAALQEMAASRLASAADILRGDPPL